MENEVTREEIQALIQSNKDMTAQNELLAKKVGVMEGMIANNAGPRILKAITERDVNIRMVNDKAVVGYVNKGSEHRTRYVYDKMDPRVPGKVVQFVDLILDGDTKDTKPISLSITQFRRESMKVKCRVLKATPKEWRKVHGTVPATEIEQYSKVDKGYHVELEEKGVTMTYVVAIPEDYGGGEVTVHQDFVNI